MSISEHKELLLIGLVIAVGYTVIVLVPWFVAFVGAGVGSF